jgi:hypothetical protein
VFGDNGVQQFVFLGSWQAVNLLNDTDQYMIGNDHYLDPETHQLLTQAPGDLYQDHARVQYQYIDRRYRRLDRLTPQEAIALDTKTIDQQSRNLGGIWVIGTVFVNNILFRRTAPYRSGTPEIENNPYRTDHLEGKGHDHDEVDMSTTDAEADLMFELEAIVNEQIGRWSQTRQGALVEIAITGTFGPCNECKGRIQALIDQVRQHATDTERIRRQFAPQSEQQSPGLRLRVMSRAMNSTGPPIHGNRDTIYGYDNPIQSMTDQGNVYDKLVFDQVFQLT